MPVDLRRFDKLIDLLVDALLDDLEREAAEAGCRHECSDNAPKTERAGQSTTVMAYAKRRANDAGERT